MKIKLIELQTAINVHATNINGSLTLHDSRNVKDPKNLNLKLTPGADGVMVEVPNGVVVLIPWANVKFAIIHPEEAKK